MAYNTNPYTDRRYGPALSATAGFLNAYQQYQQQAMQMAQFRRQMEDSAINRQFGRSLQALRESQLESQRGKRAIFEKLSEEEQKIATFPSLRPSSQASTRVTFKLSDINNVTRLAQEAWNAAQRTPAGKRIKQWHLPAGWEKRKDIISQSDALKAYRHFQNLLSYTELTPEEQQQADAVFDMLKGSIDPDEISEVRWSPYAREVQELRPYLQKAQSRALNFPKGKQIPTRPLLKKKSEDPLGLGL